MPIVDLYARQTVGLARRNGIKDNGQPLYEAKVKIKARFEEKRSFVRNAQGEEVVSEAMMLTASKVAEGDVVAYGDRQWTVLCVSALVGLDGNVTHYEVWL